MIDKQLENSHVGQFMIGLSRVVSPLVITGGNMVQLIIWTWHTQYMEYTENTEYIEYTE